MPSPPYVLISLHPNGTALMEHRSHGEQLWVSGRLRRSVACNMCLRQMIEGELAYLPITRLPNMADRLCAACVEHAAAVTRQ